MPEIVKSGPSKHHAKCNKCGCEFKYETKEIETNYVQGAKGVWCPTPQCGEFHRHWIRL